MGGWGVGGGGSRVPWGARMHAKPSPMASTLLRLRLLHARARAKAGVGSGGRARQEHPREAHRALCEMQAILDPFSPMAKVAAVTIVLPYAGLLGLLLSPKLQSMRTNYISH